MPEAALWRGKSVQDDPRIMGSLFIYIYIHINYIYICIVIYICICIYIYMGMGQNCSKPCTPVVHIKVAGIYGCSSIQHMQVVTIYVQRFPKSWGYPQIIQVMNDHGLVLRPMALGKPPYVYTNTYTLYNVIIFICLCIYIYTYMRV